MFAQVGRAVAGTRAAGGLGESVSERPLPEERIELVLENRSPRTASRLAAVGLALLAAVVIPAGGRGAAEARDEQPQAESPEAASPKPRDAAAKATGNEKPLVPAETFTAADEVQALQGTWKFDIYYSDWWPERISDPPIGWSKWRWTIRLNEIRWTGMKVPDVKLAFTVDPSKSPRQIDMTFLDGPHKGKKLLGMYEFFAEGACHICFADPDAKVRRPIEVAYSTNSGQTMISIERVPPEESAAEDPAPKEKVADRGPEIDAAIARLRKQGAMVREFHPCGDPQSGCKSHRTTSTTPTWPTWKSSRAESRCIFTSAIHRSHRPAWSGWRRPAGSTSWSCPETTPVVPKKRIVTAILVQTRDSRLAQEK